VRSGCNVLVGAAARRIMKQVNSLSSRKPSSKWKGIFGDGRASHKIVETLADLL